MNSFDNKCKYIMSRDMIYLTGFVYDIFQEFFKNKSELQHGLTVVEDDHWKFMRNTLLPTFSSGKMRKVCTPSMHCSLFWRMVRRQLRFSPLFAIMHCL